ncbi:hypothetical protein GBAR_LOCUS10664 [Geodia barretti]|uniref:Uncharacterized protein n=2 Tax=Geodia barretti TaxID=519541 RepID=A0AA35RUN5_GEOBA|nr:hypothetical protein GBAR_LOCUS10664 [Geodia barretti]
MCVRLNNKRHCLTLQSLTGLLQVLIALPIIVVSFIVFTQSSLGGALSPFWAGFLLLIAGVVGLLVRPTKLASVILADIIFNALAITACFLAAGMTGIYGTSVQLDNYDQLQVLEGSGGSEGDCIFADGSPLYSESFRSSMEPLDRLVPSCEDLESYWKHLVSLMSLSIMGLLVSLVAIVINCVTPCVEDRADSITWYPKTDV